MIGDRQFRARSFWLLLRAFILFLGILLVALGGALDDRQLADAQDLVE